MTNEQVCKKLVRRFAAVDWRHYDSMFYEQIVDDMDRNMRVTERERKLLGEDWWEISLNIMCQQFLLYLCRAFWPGQKTIKIRK